ncbi:MAG: 2-oxoacid:acceptor oxidoreductase family protein [Thermoplasmata archaeon]|nr:2-oxoacid:acceptor oxidoreductase family protein [Thermoplasmata archaeon]
MRIEIKFGGLGGQGIITAGYITAKAAAIYDGKESTFTQDYSAEARGGASTSEVVISDEKINYPQVINADYLVLMSQSAYRDYLYKLKKGGILLIDEDLVKPDERVKDYKVYKIPATRFAEEIGNPIVANIVMLGFFTAITGVVSKDAMWKAIEERIPKRFLEMNEKAFIKGYEYGEKIKGK